MEMKDKLSHFLEHYINPFFAVDLLTKEVIFMNKVAEKLFGTRKEQCDFYGIFEKSTESLDSAIRRTLHPERADLLCNFSAVNRDGETILVDLQLGYFNVEQTEFFLEVIPQKDTRMEMALHHVEHSLRPECILNFEENLSIVHCNKLFHDIFDSSEELRHSHFQNKLVNGFLPEAREKLIADIKKNLSKSSTYNRKIQVFTASGAEHWYFMEMERRTLDNSGMDKILVQMTNIEKQMELEEEHLLMQQYLAAMQELTGNVLYRVDTKTRILTHTVDSPIAKKLGAQLTDYSDIFIQEKVVHIDDADRYLDYLQSFYAESDSTHEECIVRLALFTEKYQWYHIKGKKIFDKDGELIEILGAMINIDETESIKEEFTALNQYFTAVQNLSDDILFHIDLEKRLFSHSNQNAVELGLSEKSTNYSDILINNTIIHPEDVPYYRDCVAEVLMGARDSYRIRCAISNGAYQWFEIRCEFIYDKEGKITEIFGRSRNIHKEKTILKEFSLVDQYFAVMQELTSDELFHVDLDTKTFWHNKVGTIEYGIDLEIPDFPTTMVREKMVHPDYVEQFQKDVEDLLSGKKMEYKVLSLVGKDKYEWYSIHGRFIYNEQGEAVEIFGRMKNIHDKMEG